MTFYDLNCYKFEFSGNVVMSQICEATAGKRIISDELWPTKLTFQHCIDYVDIAGRSSARGLQSEYSWRK